MKNSSRIIENFEQINGQISTVHDEISILSKKNPDGKINVFKIKFINQLIEGANSLLGEEYLPLKGFEHFIEEDLPSNSDVVFVLAQYLSSLEQMRTKHITQDYGIWYWKIEGEKTEVKTYPPQKLTK